MSLNISDIYKDNYPSKWSVFDSQMPGVPLDVFGFAGEVGDVNRWAARYRAAASFESISLKDYQSQDTVDGYSALIKAKLVWSAFERYLPLVSVDQKSCEVLLKKYDTDSISKLVSQIDGNNRFYSYLRSRVTNRSLGTELDKYIQGDPCNISYLLSAIRHIFGHGYLTPSANEADSRSTVAICNLLSDFHLRVMDEDFSSHVIEFEKIMEEAYK